MTDFRPSIARQLFAHVLAILGMVGVFAGAAIYAWQFGKIFTPEFLPIVIYMLCLLFSGVAGFLVSMVLGGQLLHVALLRSARNFKLGDTVYILKGPYKGVSAPIYELWPPRHQVRVTLGENEKKSLTDVFSYNEIVNLSR